tara:strand:+ start:3040 stop:3591 length:552 start_codon:yes stop_codon:yes gene_type:complete
MIDKDKIELMVNQYLKSKIDKVKQSFSKHSSIVMSMEPYIRLIKNIQVEFTEDKFYKPNTLIDSARVDCDLPTTFKYSGLGNLKIICYWDTTASDYEGLADEIGVDPFESICGWFLPKTLSTVFKYVGVSMYECFMNIDITHLNNNGDIIIEEEYESYDSYQWENVCEDLNPYWSIIDNTNLK